jgi:glycosyltransferase involved in cell wall biosynthesis
MENKIDLSVIIPMHNSEKYIQETIASILSQKEHGLNYEIIIVDDLSTDNSREVVKNLQHERIKLIELKKNCGSANARNIGMKSAQGNWIQFMDSDDKISLDLYKKFAEANKTNIDCFVFSVIIENYKNKIKRTITEVNDKRTFGYFYVVWNKFIKRELCIPFKVEFSFEDTCFVIEMMNNREWNIALIEDTFYIYNQKNADSKMANFNIKEYEKMYSYIYSQIDACDELTKMFILETFVGIAFSRGMPLLMRLRIAFRTMLKLYKYIPDVYRNGIRNRIKNTVIN